MFLMPVSDSREGPESYHVYIPCTQGRAWNMLVRQEITVEQKDTVEFFSSPSGGKQWTQFIWPHAIHHIPMNVFLKLGSNNHRFQKYVIR